eukprot:SM000003S11134  [mRNA]  locus=s3:1172629:1176558:- [translate_table: standard]
MDSWRRALGLLLQNRWLGLVAGMWILACAGSSYTFAIYSPALKSRLRYSQQQIASLAVAKDVGDSVGILAGMLCDVLPPAGMLLLGGSLNLLGFGGLWMVASGRVPQLPFWQMCTLIGLGTNGTTWFNTAVLVTVVRNFPKSRGQVVGILKGFLGLGAAVFAQLYTAIYSPDQVSFLLLISVLPLSVNIAVCFFLRPLHQVQEESEEEEHSNFSFIYFICLFLAFYLSVAVLVQEFTYISREADAAIAGVMLAILFMPLVTPVRSTLMKYIDKSLKGARGAFEALQNEQHVAAVHEHLLPEKDTLASESIQEENEEQYPSQAADVRNSGTSASPRPIISHADEEVLETDEDEERTVEPFVRHAPVRRITSQLLLAVGEGAVKRRKGPRRGEDFTLSQAVVKADFWLLFFGCVCGCGSGMTAINNLAQIGQAQGYTTVNIFVSMVSIWNFLGRLGAGYLSEKVVREHALPRPIILAMMQLLMSIGHLLFALAVPSSLYIGSLLIGLGYGAHWAIMPATASELFGLKNFGILYNTLTISNPAGSYLFSGLLAGYIYDREAAKGHREQYSSFEPHNSAEPAPQQCTGAHCFRLTFFVMMGVCFVGVILNVILIVRTRPVYKMLYGKLQEGKRISVEGLSKPVTAVTDSSQQGKH